MCDDYKFETIKVQGQIKNARNKPNVRYSTLFPYEKSNDN